MQKLKRQNKPRIKMIDGNWYAYPGYGLPLPQSNLMLVPAINFCRQLNSERSLAHKGMNHDNQ